MARTKTTAAKKPGDLYASQEMENLKKLVDSGKLKKGSTAYKKKVTFVKQVAEKMNEVPAPEAEAATEEKKARKERTDKGVDFKFNEMGAEWDMIVGKNTRDIVDRFAQDIEAGTWTLQGAGGNNKNGIGRYQNYQHKESGTKIQVKEVDVGLFQVKLWGPKPPKPESKPKGSKGEKNIEKEAEADKGKGAGAPPSPLSPSTRSSRAVTAAALAAAEAVAPENFNARVPTAAAPPAAAPTAAAPTAAAPTAAAPTAAVPTAAEKKKNNGKRGAAAAPVAAAPAGDKRPRRACAPK